MDSGKAEDLDRILEAVLARGALMLEEEHRSLESEFREELKLALIIRTDFQSRTPAPAQQDRIARRIMQSLSFSQIDSPKIIPDPCRRPPFVFRKMLFGFLTVTLVSILGLFGVVLADPAMPNETRAIFQEWMERVRLIPPREQLALSETTGYSGVRTALNTYDTSEEYQPAEESTEGSTPTVDTAAVVSGYAYVQDHTEENGDIPEAAATIPREINPRDIQVSASVGAQLLEPPLPTSAPAFADTPTTVPALPDVTAVGEVSSTPTSTVVSTPSHMPLPTPVVGDVNMDGTINYNDLELLTLLVNDNQNLNREQLRVSDCLADNVLDDFDLQALHLFLLGYETLPVLPADLPSGDVNGDSQVTPGDALLVQQHLEGTISLAGQAARDADACWSGQINVADREAIFSLYLGQIPSLPVLPDTAQQQ